MALALHNPTDDSKCYVYRHIRKDKNEVFYVGIGTRGRFDSFGRAYARAFSKSGRGKIWNNITNQCGYDVEIVLDDLTKDESISKEIELIGLYGRKNTKGCGTLANMTDGGDGLNRVVDDTIRAKFSKAAKLRIEKYGHPWKGKHHSEESKKKSSESKKLFFATVTPEIRAKWKKQVWSDEQRKKIAERSKSINTGAGNVTSKQVINIESGQIYPCTREAAEQYGIPRPTLQTYLRGECTNITPLRRYANGEIVETEPRKSIFRKVINTLTGQIYPSASDLARSLNIKPQSFLHRLYNKEKGFNVGAKKPFPYEWH